METPSSTRRVTRSQTLAAPNNTNSGVSTLRKIEELDPAIKSRNNGKQQHDRSPLIDITNDSPIVGLAMGSLETPTSALSKKRFSSRTKHDLTPGSGEALLRCQVETLLQKVEEEAELSKFTFENRPLLQIQGFINSPLAFVAPTPANSPQVLNLSGNGSCKITTGLDPSTQSPVEDKFLISQLVTEIFEGKKQEGNESQKNLMITRSLLLDFSEKSEGSSSYSSECLSDVTIEGGGDSEVKESTDDDDASIWSIQVNASTKDDEEDDEEEEEEGLDEVEEECDNDNLYEEEENEEKEDDTGCVDELCEAISQINVNGGRTFAGKHIRFLYNSDDELEGVAEDCSIISEPAAAGSWNLKGLPTSKGKHIRFPDEEEEE